MTECKTCGRHDGEHAERCHATINAQVERHGWVAGYNMVGYLPEMEPYATDDWLSAVEFLLGEMNRYVDAMTDTEFEPVEVDETIEAIIDLNAETDTDIEVSYVCGNTAYWVQPCFVTATEDGFEVVDA